MIIPFWINKNCTTWNLSNRHKWMVTTKMCINLDKIKSYILIFLFVCHGARVRHKRPTGPGPAFPDSRISTDRARRGGCRARSVTKGRPALWSPARVERARPFSGSQHGGSVAWRRSAALLQAREEEEEDRGEKRRREERGLEEERYAAASERKGGGGQRREERSWLELIKIRISFFLLRLSRVFKQEVLSLVFFRWRCWGNQIVKQKPGGGGGGGVEARDFTVSEGHGHPLVSINFPKLNYI